jgi:hypothetical protein
MAIPSQQIGWSQKSKLLWNIAKQLETLTKVAGNVEVGPVGPTTTTTSTSSTTTTTTTVAPGPTPSFTGTIGVSTVTPGNEQFRFSMSVRDLGSNMNVTVNWGDNTSDTYSISNSSPVFPFHNYSSNAAFTVTLTIDNPTLLDTINIDRNNNESTAVVTGFDFGDFNGIAQLVASNSVLHTADTAGLNTLNILNIQNADLESLALVNAGSLQTLYAQNNNLSVLDLTSATILSYADLSNNELVGLDIDNAASLIYLDLSNNALAEPNVDSILLALVANNQTNGTLNLTGIANDGPSATGLSAKATLEARGWTVSVNTSSNVQSTLMYWATGNSNITYQGLTYFSVSENKYKLYQVSELPRTVYYTGALGVNTVLWTNPEMTEFNAPASWNNYPYIGVIFSDVAIDRTNVNSSLQTYQIYKFNQINLIDSNPGTVATISWNNAYFKASSSITPCDVEWEQNRSYFYNTPTIGLNTSIGESLYNGNWDWPNQSYITEYTGGTSVYQLDWNNDYTAKIVTAITPCTFTPTWTATWGYTQQDAIDGVNSFSIKPDGYYPGDVANDFTFNGCQGIKLANGNSMSSIINNNVPVWVVYNGMIKQFVNLYGQNASYDIYNYPAVEPVTPPVTPYQIVVTPGQANCSGFDSNNTITLYSNFPVITKYATAYTDAGLTTLPSQDWYTMQNNPAGYMYFSKWFYFATCP